VSDRGLLDTSVFIASESGHPLKEDLLPELGAVSVVTLAELQAGVLAARGTEIRAQLRVSLAEAGRKINVNDLWIAATAARHGVPVVSQDDDYEAVDGMSGIVVLRV
jgi:predicted nucleic acid-binding protein